MSDQGLPENPVSKNQALKALGLLTLAAILAACSPIPFPDPGKNEDSRAFAVESTAVALRNNPEEYNQKLEVLKNLGNDYWRRFVQIKFRFSSPSAPTAFVDFDGQAYIAEIDDEGFMVLVTANHLSIPPRAINDALYPHLSLSQPHLTPEEGQINEDLVRSFGKYYELINAGDDVGVIVMKVPSEVKDLRYQSATAVAHQGDRVHGFVWQRGDISGGFPIEGQVITPLPEELADFGESIIIIDEQQTTHGSSGGVIVNDFGEVIGVIRGSSNWSANTVVNPILNYLRVSDQIQAAKESLKKLYSPNP